MLGNISPRRWAFGEKWLEMHSGSQCTEREENLLLCWIFNIRYAKRGEKEAFAEYLHVIQDMKKEKKIEAFADYVLVTYVDDTVLCSHHPYGQNNSTGIIMNCFMHCILQWFVCVFGQ